jgi:hypothetical protein
MTSPTHEQLLVELKYRIAVVLDGNDWTQIHVEDLIIAKEKQWLTVSIDNHKKAYERPLVYAEFPPDRGFDSITPDFELIENYALPVLRKAMVLHDLAEA